MPVPALAVAAAPAAIAGISSFFGARSANKANRQEAQRNRDFQERMRNTSWQAGLADMRAAGLNPALAYSQGGASTPSGSTARMNDAVTPAVSSAMQMRQMTQALKLTEEQIGKTKAERESAQAAARLATDRANYLTSRGELTVGGRTYRNVPLFTQLIDAEIASARAGATNTQALAERNTQLSRIAQPMGDLSEQMGTLLPLLSLLTAGGTTGLRGLAAIRQLRKKRR